MGLKHNAISLAKPKINVNSHNNIVNGDKIWNPKSKETVLLFNVKLVSASLFVQSEYTNNSVVGEKFLLPILQIQSLVGDKLKANCSNARFYHEETGTFLKSKLIDNQGIKFLVFEVPHTIIQGVSTVSNVKTIPLQLVISDDIVYFGDTSIFRYYYNIKELGTFPPQPSMYSYVDYPTPGARTPTTNTVNGETVVTTPPYVNNNFLVGNFNFQHVLAIYNHGGNFQHGIIWLNQPYNSHSDKNTNLNCQNHAGDGPNGSVDWNKYFYKQNTSWSSQLTVPRSTWLLLDFRSQNNVTGYHYPDLIGNPNYFASLNATYNKAGGTYMLFRKWSATGNISLVCSMQNPYTSKNGTVAISDFKLK